MLDHEKYLIEISNKHKMKHFTDKDDVNSKIDEEIKIMKTMENFNDEQKNFLEVRL